MCKFIIVSLLVLSILALSACNQAVSTPTAVPATVQPTLAPTPLPEAAFRLEPSKRTADGDTEGVYYEVFVRAFADSDGDGTGDLKGLTAKLDYLNDGNDATTTDLGVTGLWLMPVFETVSYHGYDVVDYYKINPQYGTMDNFNAFVAAAHKRGISVILDMVLNHTSSQNKKFIDSVSPASPYRAWYDWIGPDSEGYMLTQKIWGHNVWNKLGDGYYAGIFDKSMPDLNYDNPDVRAEAKAVAKYWLDAGVDGFRLDAAMHLYNGAKLKGNVDGEPKCLAWWQEYTGYCRTVKPGCYIVGEVWDAAAIRAKYMAPLGSDFNFGLGEAIVQAIKNGQSPKNYLATMMAGQYTQFAAANPNYIDAPFLSNHDQNRIMALLGGDVAKMKLAASIYLTLEGLPFVYYGEEIGMMGAKPDEQIRTPMLWGATDPLTSRWVTSKYNKNTVPVDKQDSDPASLLNHYRRLIQLRTSNEALYKGCMSPLEPGNDAVIGWTMDSAGQQAIVLHNLSKLPQALKVNTDGYTLAFSTVQDCISIGNSTVTLPPMDSVVFIK